MDFNAMLIGQAIAVWIIVATVLTFLLAKRKTQTPTVATIVGFLFSFIPPVSIIYLVVLVLKNDVVNSDVGA